MIIDSHCHGWERWPYQPPVPDDTQRGRLDQLLHEMDRHGVQRALVVSAQIDRNPANNRYVAGEVARHPDRLVQLADVDSSWSSTYHAPGAADRLARVAGAWPIAGFTHYLADDDPGDWLSSEEGVAFFEVAAAHRLLASIACRPHHQRALREIARRFPSITFLCHHLSGIRADDDQEQALAEVLASAAVPNIYLKLSGFAYYARRPWDFPYADTMWLVRAVYEAYGPHRLCWGSDYPVVRFFMTYQQSLEAVRSHCRFIPEADQALILGGTLERVLAAR